MIDDRGVLALDLGTRLGWALWVPSRVAAEARRVEDRVPATRGYEEAWRWGCVDLPSHAANAALHFTAAHRALETLLRGRWYVRLVVIEAPNSRNWAASCVAYGLRAIALLECHRNTIDAVEVSPAEAKKAATGKGNAKKHEVLAAARARWGDGVATEDEADALWALAFALENVEVERGDEV